ncbi:MULTISPECIES: DUF4300 family protein [unclassified Clostridioides]|uniref:DUF4300 family protein n=1 Tax=unclassified Clostridioides TaxID=2635829 RepID=UPI001D0C9A82|nr:DUF4300 family protein [Clostridioides sp. ES-S-0049-03]MCC0653325.1 DUF4300 family protein [Clostridioides sp. ES-S-0001-03]MCC0676047.1 DUF4300 family protein [Clostridioides sp. ES-W-0018-02]MCC0681378.1 DUF4300 family protein [Clostridioides sp. ES-S-0005-03]MCC0695644.1 DUF4300 family protein [Clostridioides sp. ES-S-0048-02]MCC0703936.1 DUF4300 family protein [Clostridioides sp. ES-S-0049-02]MCC0710874.1 DUF4300 family protein [Clostridioides sp. ES-W-0017-02]UDN48254.1 DUF4300 fami
MRKNLLIAILSAILVLSSILTIFAYSTIKDNSRLVYSNIIDRKIENQVKNVLEKNKINKKDIDIFIKSVRSYNKLQIKILQNNVNISKSGYSSINTKQVPYNLDKLQSNWMEKFPNYMDVNCRITAFRLFKDFINSKEKFTGDSIDLSIDLDTIMNNRDAKFNSKDVEKFINFFSAIPTQDTDDINKNAEQIKKEWKKRKISFKDNKNMSIISGFLRYPETKNVFIGHTGICIKTDKDILFIEKYGSTSPYQVTKFKSKKDVKNYMFNRLKMSEGNVELLDPIIMENDKLMQ